LIHGNSNDPVLIKRISLKIWSLRDEVESVIQQHLAHNADGKSLSPSEMEEIRNEYSYDGSLPKKAGLQLIDGGAVPEAEASEESEDDLEAAMAAAMGGGDEEAQEGGDDLEAEMAAAMGDGEEKEITPSPSTQGPKKIIQRGSHNIKPEKTSRGVTILSELSMESLYFFSQNKFTEGQSIVIEFQVPKKFVLNAIVNFCRPFNISSRIISNRKVEYRTVARFTFLKEGERTLLREFIKSIEPDIPEQVASPDKSKNQADDDDFDGLDGLDF